jgi:hypothetical protein
MEFRRLLRIYEDELLHLSLDDLPKERDPNAFIKFTHLYSALLEVKEKRATCFRQRQHFDLLKSKPTPQDQY